MDKVISRKELAKEKGLPETATWSEINHYNSEISRKELAKEKGLLETATWSEITSLL